MPGCKLYMATKGSINGSVWVWNGRDSPGMIPVARTNKIHGGAWWETAQELRTALSLGPYWRDAYPHISPANETLFQNLIQSRRHVKAHGDALEGKWRGNWRMEWVTSTLHTTSEHGVSSITTADAHTSDAISRLNWRPYRFKWTRPFCRKTKSGFCACAITVQTQYTSEHRTINRVQHWIMKLSTGGKVKVVPVQAAKAYRGRRAIAPLFLNLIIR